MPKPKQQPKTHSQPGYRFDRKSIQRFVEKNSTTLSIETLDIYILYWIRKKSVAQISKALDLSRDTVYKRIKRLRRNAKNDM
jgi:DNA-directed RNA polymerase specialized sigma24 family protein